MDSRYTTTGPEARALLPLETVLETPTTEVTLARTYLGPYLQEPFTSL